LCMIALYAYFAGTIGAGTTAAIVMIILGFFFAAVSGNLVGMIGSSNNPISGLTLATVIVAALLMVSLGVSGQSGVAAVLGLPTKAPEASAIRLISRIEHGLPVKALEKVAHLIAPDDTQFKYRLVPKATLERRKTTNKLSPEESARLARLAKVWAAARDVWGGDDEARDFLFRRNLMADDNRPIDLVIQSEFGADLILDILGGLKYGTAI